MMNKRNNKRPGARLRRAEKRQAVDRSVVLGISMLLFIWAMSSYLVTVAGKRPQEIDTLVIGQRAPETISAAFDFSYEDQDATQKAREEARRHEPLFFRVSPAETDNIKLRMEQFRDAISLRAKNSSPEPGSETAVPLPVQLAATFSDREIRALDYSGESANAARAFESELNTILADGVVAPSEKSKYQSWQKIRVVDHLSRERLPRPIGEQTDSTQAGKQLAESILNFYPAGSSRTQVAEKLTAAMTALVGAEGNLFFDPKRTEAGRDEAEARVVTVSAEIRRHQSLVLKGEKIDEATLRVLNIYSRQSAERAALASGWATPLRNMFWSFTLVVLAGFYLYHIHPDIVRSNRKVCIAGSVVILSLACNYAGIKLFDFLASGSRSLSPALVTDIVPLGLVAVLTAAFMGFRVAMSCGFFVASITALMLDLSFEFSIKGIVACAFTALAVRSATNYRSFFIRTAGTVFPLFWALNINVFSAVSDWNILGILFLQSGILSAVNALATALIALIVIFVYELIFHVSTNMSLMVLCDYNHPLLERLKREAPGTFFHSLMVATLAEDAARAIDANYLKAKAGALFHDIGKLSKPQYFTENNLGMPNLHTELTPQMSSIIIREHVKEGADLARAYKLGSVITDTIEQHHGNDLVHYFYRRAVDNSRHTGESVPELQFRYQGTPPQSKEVAIVSLADACEAACRSLEKPSASRIESLVDDIFLKRYTDDQLLNADLTLAELHKIRESFINTLLSMKHGRVSYDKKDAEEEDDEDDLFVAAERENQRKAEAAAAPKTDSPGR